MSKTPITDKVQYDTGLRVDERDEEPDYVVPADLARALEEHCEAISTAATLKQFGVAVMAYQDWKRDQLK